MKKLILIEGNDKQQFDTLEEMIKLLINDKYYEMDELEKKKIMEMKAFANSIPFNVNIVTNLEDANSLDGKFVIYDEITYILSLLLLNKVTLLENTDSNIFTKYLDKSGITDNYIIVNKFAEELLKAYMKNRWRWKYLWHMEKLKENWKKSEISKKR